ncbi:hypothetical protein [Haloglycomyces albus]|uniref:hypothetical protein n=1 Tax=Haloglycomyces albus TaxID=526067 RepID=UPI00046CC4F7|nr:hypothetical protein [Haloglycomyces albus]
MAHQTFNDPWGSGECESEHVSHNYVERSNWQLCHRIDWNGLIGVHGERHAERFHPNAWRQLGRVARDLDDLGRRFHPSGRSYPLTWLGDVGVKVCKPGWHRFGLAVDLSRISWGSQYVDFNAHWRPSVASHLRLRYLAAVAVFRCHFGVVLHAYNDPDGSHANHVHLDRSRHAVALARDYLSDQSIIHLTANWLLGRNLRVAEGWGDDTEAAYQDLLECFGMASRSDSDVELDPLTRADHFRMLLRLIARTAFHNAEPGVFIVPSTPNAESPDES